MIAEMAESARQFPVGCPDIVRDIFFMSFEVEPVFLKGFMVARRKRGGSIVLEDLAMLEASIGDDLPVSLGDTVSIIVFTETER